MIDSKLVSMWTDYFAFEVDKTIAEDDDMFKKSARGWDEYSSVGKDAAKVIFSVLANTPAQNIKQALDFGCGHGRVARFLRAMFPNSQMFFSDIDESCYKFCANQFNGEGFPSYANFSRLDLPGNVDLIWVGSVFTHLDWDRSLILWDKLFDALSVGGALIATFAGKKVYQIMLSDSSKNRGYYNPLLRKYEKRGFGYQDYRGFENWGQSLLSIKKCIELPDNNMSAKLIGYTEAGWANRQDVASWTKK